MADITPKQHKISSRDYVAASSRTSLAHLYKPLMSSLPSNDDLKSLLTSFSTRLTNRYLVTRIIHHHPDPDPDPDLDHLEHLLNITSPFYSVAKPFVWHRNESAGCVLDERSGDKLRGVTKGDQVSVNDINEMKS